MVPTALCLWIIMPLTRGDNEQSKCAKSKAALDDRNKGYLTFMESTMTLYKPTQPQRANPKWQCFPCKTGMRITLHAQPTQYLPLHITDDRATDPIPLSVEL